jgi:hypothetical protein
VRSLRGALLALVVAGLWASPAAAELTQEGDLFVSFGGGLSPGALPRHTLSPIAVSVQGGVRTLSGQEPPALRQIVIELNRAGHLDTRGLPTCRRGQIKALSSNAALAACGPALVGEGSFAANTAFPEQSTFPSGGRILAFNSIVGGKRAILAHIYGAHPVPTARVIIFHIEAGQGPYGTVLRGSLPESINPHGYVEYISLHLHRTYLFHGRLHSYLSAACAAPAGFTAASFPFAHAAMSFADGQSLSSTLTRTCRVRG